MIRIARAATLTVASCAVLLGGAGIAAATGGAHAEAVAFGSPGIASGNVVQVPVNAQFNVCGNSVNVFGALNPAFGNICVNR
ncbi:MAG TPA: chaplin [Streptomyces sp.]|nr:chaplin [Streptomyces sp.]